MSCGMASRALPYTLQELCFWQSASFPPLWSLQTGRSETLNVPPVLSPLNGAGLEVTSAGATFTAATNPPRATSCPLPVFVCAEYGLQHHPLFFNGSLGMGGNTDREIRGDREPKYHFPPKLCPLPAP